MTPYTSPLYNGLTPYHLHGDTKMVDITLVCVRRDDTGDAGYYVPQGEVLLTVECEDGMILLVWEKK